ncbi:MAG: zinc ribbon domain-containing protein [Verrucomicrobia bacterium]|nr:zinc ribbon domain-containing protein [Verrucomicrobiota bacterium]
MPYDLAIQRVYPMTYSSELDNGQRLVAENDDANTSVMVGSGNEGQQQSQSSKFATGKWKQPPELFRTQGQLILRLQLDNGPYFIRISGGQIQHLDLEPNLTDAEKIPMKESNLRTEKMAPMKPMAPMEPMKPMQPLKPLEGMRPMEMRMGNMHMVMGDMSLSSQATGHSQRYCTQCGKPAGSADRFCGSCGYKLAPGA